MEIVAENYLLAFSVLALLYLSVLFVAWKTHAFAGKNLLFRAMIPTLLIYSILYASTMAYCFILCHFRNTYYTFLFSSAIAGFFLIAISSIVFGLIYLWGQLLFGRPE